MTDVYLSLGSNCGHRLNHLRRAFEQLTATQVLSQATPSVVLETQAILPENAPEEWDKPYLNMVVRGTTSLAPEVLLERLQGIETALGRDKNHPHWGPRPVDIDILLYGDHRIQSDHLTIPHPALKQRWFLVHLLATVAPQLVDPETNRTFLQLAQDQWLTIRRDIGQTLVLYPKFVGIVNVTPDSFSDGGAYFSPNKAVQHCRELVQAGASILDIGAQSTRPGAIQVGVEEEWRRLQPVLDHLDLKQIPVSIDTYQEEIVMRLLQRYPIAWINDVSGRLGKKTLRAVAEAGCALCTMHSLSIPPQPGTYCSPLWETLDAWCQTQVELLQDCGFSRDKIILDPGIGFGKSPYQTGELIKKMARLKRWGCPLLVGHSRKSFLDIFGEKSPQQRDVETLAVSQSLMDKADYLRVHSVAPHQRFFSVQQWISSIYEDSTD